MGSPRGERRVVSIGASRLAPLEIAYDDGSRETLPAIFAVDVESGESLAVALRVHPAPGAAAADVVQQAERLIGLVFTRARDSAAAFAEPPVFTAYGPARPAEPSSADEWRLAAEALAELVLEEWPVDGNDTGAGFDRLAGIHYTHAASGPAGPARTAALARVQDALLAALRPDGS